VVLSPASGSSSWPTSKLKYCGLTLAGLGADVIKIEPPGGSPTRRIGPFYEDREDRERSLFFWQYNRGSARSCSTRTGQRTATRSAR